MSAENKVIASLLERSSSSSSSSGDSWTSTLNFTLTTYDTWYTQTLDTTDGDKYPKPYAVYLSAKNENYSASVPLSGDLTDYIWCDYSGVGDLQSRVSYDSATGLLTVECTTDYFSSETVTVECLYITSDADHLLTGNASICIASFRGVPACSGSGEWRVRLYSDSVFRAYTTINRTQYAMTSSAGNIYRSTSSASVYEPALPLSYTNDADTHYHVDAYQSGYSSTSSYVIGATFEVINASAGKMIDIRPWCATSVTRYLNISVGVEGLYDLAAFDADGLLPWSSK